jgi:hypothetical protein
MESFGTTLERLTRTLVADLIDAVRAELAASTAKRRVVVRRLVRPAPRVVADAPVVVRSNFEIPVGRPRVRRNRGPRRLRETKPPVLLNERQATFEVVPHPERTNRRLVLTHLG